MTLFTYYSVIIKAPANPKKAQIQSNTVAFVPIFKNAWR